MAFPLPSHHPYPRSRQQQYDLPIKIVKELRIIERKKKFSQFINATKSPYCFGMEEIDIEKEIDENFCSYPSYHYCYVSLDLYDTAKVLPDVWFFIGINPKNNFYQYLKIII